MQSSGELIFCHIAGMILVGCDDLRTTVPRVASLLMTRGNTMVVCGHGWCYFFEDILDKSILNYDFSFASLENPK